MPTVLILDDDELNLTVLENFVRGIEGCVPVPFTDPRRALDWLRIAAADLLVVDFMMPHLNGLQFVGAVRHDLGLSEVPVLMVTANEHKEVRYQALSGGVQDFLNKPVDRIEFVARAQNMLALRANQKFQAELARNLAGLVDKLVDERVRDIRLQERELVSRIARAAEVRDPGTGEHIQRVAHYARLIARNLGLSESDQALIFEAGPMHDVGKIGIPDVILLKQGRLAPEEFVIMQRHARLGFDLLAGGATELVRTAAEIALTHHERIDGLGYPDGRRGEEIPLFGRIVAVADVFDALTSFRPYKAPWALHVAARYLRENAGSHVDAACVEAFLGSWDEVKEIRAQFADEAPAAAAGLHA